jgi:invasion protein IalB
MLFAHLILGFALLPAISNAQSNEAATQEDPSTIVETYRDWVVRCDSASPGGRRCEMAQELRQADQRLVFATLVQHAQDGMARIVFIAPFGLSLREGLRLEKEGLELEALTFATCYATGCIAEATIDREALGQLLDGESIGVAMTSMTGDRVDITVSLAGFGGAWRRLESFAE